MKHLKKYPIKAVLGGFVLVAIGIVGVMTSLAATVDANTSGQEVDAEDIAPILERPSGPNDALPRGVPQEWLEGQVNDPHDTRLALSRSGVTYYVAKGETDHLCLIRIADDGMLVYSCSDPWFIQQHGLFVVFGRTSDELRVFGLLPPGFNDLYFDDTPVQVTNQIFDVWVGASDRPDLAHSALAERPDGKVIEVDLSTKWPPNNHSGR